MSLSVLHKHIIAEGGHQEQAKENKFSQIFQSEEAAGNQKGDKRDCLTEDKGNERLCPERHHEVMQMDISE